jgi:hypothetical protein
VLSDIQSTIRYGSPTASTVTSALATAAGQRARPSGISAGGVPLPAITA